MKLLDNAVINFCLEFLGKSKGIVFDSVRGMCTEGERIYEGTSFQEKTHIQIPGSANKRIL